MLTLKQKIQRRTGIGGSDVAAVFGKSPWKNPIDLYLEKINTETPIADEENEYIFWGNVMEPIIAKIYAKRKMVKLLKGNKLFRHPEYKFLIGNIDYYYYLPNGDKKIVEIKTSSEFKNKEWGEEDTDELPEYYLLQVHAYLLIMDVKECDVAVLIGGNKLKIYTVKRDYELDQAIIQKCKEFWECVLNKKPPQLSVSKDWYKLHGNDIVELNIEATQDIKLNLKQYFELSKQIKELETKQEELKTIILQYMGNNQNLTINKHKIAYLSIIKPTLTLDTEKILQDADLKAKYLTKQKNGYAKLNITKFFKESFK